MGTTGSEVVVALGNRSPIQVGAIDQERAITTRSLGTPAIPEEIHDFLADLHAAGTPAAGARQPLRTTSETVETHHLRLAGQERPQFRPQPWIESEFQALAQGFGHGAEIAFCHARLARRSRGGGDTALRERSDGTAGDLVAEAGEHVLQRVGEFHQRDRIPPEIVAEIMQDGRGGLPDHLRIQVFQRLGEHLDGQFLHRARDLVAAGDFKYQAVGA